MGEFSFDSLIGSIREVDSQFVSSAAKAVNVSLTMRNWCVGAYIAEFELHGAERAAYGERLFERIAAALREAGLRRCDVRELKRFVMFYRVYPQIGDLLSGSVREQYLSICSEGEKQRHALIEGIWETSSPKFKTPPEKLVSSLSYSHICEIMQLEPPVKRLFYETECIRGCWSVRELKRQIDLMYFERSGLSKDKEALAVLANSGSERMSPSLAIRDPYVFEFLSLTPREVMEESAFESALLPKVKDVGEFLAGEMQVLREMEPEYWRGK